MIITVCGIGYSGLMISLFLCELGHKVNCFDNNQQVLDELRKENNNLNINEPGISKLVSDYIKLKKITLFNNINDAITNTDVIIVKIPVKGNLDSLEDINLKPFNDLINSIILYLNRNKYIPIFISTTVPIGTCSMVVLNIQNTRPDLAMSKHYDIICAPIFLREGSALHDLMKPDRLIFGFKQESELADNVIKKIYKPLKLRNIPFIYTNFETAELIKTATMGLATVNMAFTNEIEKLCTSVGVDFNTLAKGVGLDKRVGKESLIYNAGVGGSSLPRTSRVLINSAKQFGIDLSILSVALESNMKRIKGISSQILKYYEVNNKQIKNIKRVAILGLAFKGLTTDITESPSIFVIQELLDNSISVALYDPYYLPCSNNLNGIPHKIKENPAFYICDSVYDAVSQSDVLVVMTKWPEFNSLNIPKIIELMQRNKFDKPVLFDCVNMFSQYNTDFTYIAA